jgi:integrase
MPIKTKHMFERGGRYYARISVPLALRPIIGKLELLETLGADLNKAKRQLPSTVGRMIALLDVAKRQKFTGVKPIESRFGRKLSHEQVAKQHYQSELAIDRDVRFVGDVDELILNEFSSRIRLKALRRVAGGEASIDETKANIGWALDAFASRGNFTASTGSDEWWRLAKTLAMTQIEAIKRSMERDLGNFDGKPLLPILQEQQPDTSDPHIKRILGAESTKPLSELVGAFLKERNISVGTQHEHGVSVRMFEEFLGAPKPVYTITKRDIINYKNALLELPAHYTQRFPNLTLLRATEANKRRPVPYQVLSARTVNDKWLSAIRALLNWCVQNDFIPDNPAMGVQANYQADKGQAPRVNFEANDLAKIFSAPLFDKKKPWGEQQWCYLLSLYCGTRPTELAQTKLDSIRHERDVLVLRVQEQTKNSSSQRAIPIHSDLIRLGFNKYVQSLRTKGETHMFPQWYKDGMDALGRAQAISDRTGKPMALAHHFPKFIPKIFNNAYRKKVGINDPRKVFYSFRHTFKTGLAQAGVGKDLRDILAGHSDSSAGAGYIHDGSITALRDAIEKLKFDGLSL